MIVTRDLTYRSNVDGTEPLHATAVFDDSGTELPILAVMHGYGGSRHSVRATCQRLAGMGVLALAVDMRGRADSAGMPDAGGVEIADIADAVYAAAREFAPYVDPRSVHLLGYSAGGANAISAAARYPDLFGSAVAFFGIYDLAAWWEYARQHPAVGMLPLVVGGTPVERPELYAARSSLLAARNLAGTHVRLYWDAEEIICPPAQQQALLAALRELGHPNVAARESRPGDPHRWLHGYPEDVPDLKVPEREFIQPMVARAWDPTPIAAVGELVAAGFLETRRFRLWPADGRSAVVRCRYELAESGTGTFDLECLHGEVTVGGTLSVRYQPGVLLGLLRDEEAVATAVSRADGWAHFVLPDLSACYRVTSHLR